MMLSAVAAKSFALAAAGTTSAVATISATALRMRNLLPRISGTEASDAALLSLHLAGDHDALDLVGSLVDLRDLRVAHHALHRVLGHVSVPPEHLDGLDGHLHRDIRGEQLRHRGVDRKLRVGAVGHGARLVEQLARCSRLRL